jgi:acyl dehydratase
MKIIGQGTAVLGLGGLALSGNAWAQSGASQAKPALQAADGKWADWEFYYPNKYEESDAKILKDFQAEIDQINKKGGNNVNIKELISGKGGSEAGQGDEQGLKDGIKRGNFQKSSGAAQGGQPQGQPGASGGPGGQGPGGQGGAPAEMPGGGPGGGKRMTIDDMLTIAKNNIGNNPLFTDKEYAKKTKYGSLIAFPLISSLEVMPAMPKKKGFADYMVVSAHNDTNSYYKPFYEGDTLFTVTDEQHCIDITPSEGSYYRTFVMSGRARVFNQKGELVAEGANVLKESFRRHKDKSKRFSNGAHAWESPNWWSRPKYQYTDKDWEKIIAMWKNEKVRGSVPLYWDDVKVGDMPTPTAVGPIIVDEEMDMTMTVPQYAIDIKKNVLDPKTFPAMKKNSQGIYVLPQYLIKKPKSNEVHPGMEDANPEFAKRDGRAILQNSVAAKFAAGMICNWMGDDGWLRRIGWDIMEIPPGSDKDINFQKDPSLIPTIPKELRPALFDKYPYMEKVPSMKDKRATWHALEGDLVISNAYVTDKYQKGNEYFVDLTWWCETFDNYLVEEGFATVKLPKKA